MDPKEAPPTAKAQQSEADLNRLLQENRNLQGQLVNTQRDLQDKAFLGVAPLHRVTVRRQSTS